MGLLYEYISESSTLSIFRFFLKYFKCRKSERIYNPLSDSMNVSILLYSDSFIFEDINTVDMFGFPP